MRYVWTFFYGSFINLEVLKQYNVVPASYEVARLNGFDIDVQPLSTLVPDDARSVYGIVAEVTHVNLTVLYTLDWVGRYDPYPVLVETNEGHLIPSLCYISSPAENEKSPAAEDYVMSIINPARALGFPSWYIKRLEEFLPR